MISPLRFRLYPLQPRWTDLAVHAAARLRLERLAISPVRSGLLALGLLVGVLATGLTSLASIAVQAADAAPHVPGQRWSGSWEPRQRGALLLGELNCVACHEGAIDSGSVSAKQPPRLDQVGDRLRPEYLRAFLSDPSRVKPGTTMPALFHGRPEAAERIEALVHFMVSTGALQEQSRGGRSLARGEQLYHSVGCVACHDPQRDRDPGSTTQMETSVPLPHLAAKYTLPALAGFLQDPLRTRPSGRMPHLNLSPQEALDIAAYLLRDLKLPATVTYEYFEGSWNSLPNFERLNPVERGEAFGMDLSVAPRRDHFALRFRARLATPTAGVYRFHLGSDDGSRLLVDGEPAVVVDGIHPFQMTTGERSLSAGTHDLVVEYFEQGGDEELKLEFEGPGVARQSIESALVVQAPEDSAEAKQAAWHPDPALVARGRELFVTEGCAACHAMNSVSSVADRAAPATELRDTSGCLASTPRPGVPWFKLSQTQRSDLRAALEAIRDERTIFANPEDSPEQAIDRVLATMNCYACHRRGQRGGVESARNAWFATNQKEMGDEGRLPPELTGVGDKLQTGWIGHVLDQGAQDRPYMLTRMPRFGQANVGPLANWLEKADRHSQVPSLAREYPPRRLKADGRFLVGGQGYSCVKCHVFGSFRAEGIQAISLTTMNRRLRPGWFHQYLLDPQRYRPGTRMPAAWPNGQVTLPKILDADPHAQVQSIWTYLSDGDQAATPVGLGNSPILLEPETVPLVYRGFIQDAGTRAIAVGYPERVHQTFDANQLRVALLWHGAFLDVAPHWTGRGQGWILPLGDNVLRMPTGPSLARLAEPTSPWPEEVDRTSLEYRFLGYRLDDQQRPEFRYVAAAVQVADQMRPLATERFAPLRRTLQLDATATQAEPGSIWYRAARAGHIEPLPQEGWYQVDDWKMRLELPEGCQLTIRNSENAQELLVSIPTDRGVTLVQDYAW